MATTVYKQVEIALQDGVAVTLKPLSIGRLRRFMKVWEKFDDVKGDASSDESLNIFIELSGIALEGELGSVIDSLFVNKEMTDEYREYLEDSLDMDTIYKVMEICGGMKLNDPNLIAAATAAQQEAGKN